MGQNAATSRQRPACHPSQAAGGYLAGVLVGLAGFADGLSPLPRWVLLLTFMAPGRWC